MASYCNTNIHTKKVDTLNDMLNLENVCVQNMFLLVVKKSYLTNVTSSFQTMYVHSVKELLSSRYCLSLTVLLADLHTQEQPMFMIFCCEEEGRVFFFF